MEQEGRCLNTKLLRTVKQGHWWIITHGSTAKALDVKGTIITRLFSCIEWSAAHYQRDSILVAVRYTTGIKVKGRHGLGPTTRKVEIEGRMPLHEWIDH